MYGADKITESGIYGRIKHTEDGADKPNAFSRANIWELSVAAFIQFRDLVLLNERDDGHNLTQFRIGCELNAR